MKMTRVLLMAVGMSVALGQFACKKDEPKKDDKAAAASASAKTAAAKKKKAAPADDLKKKKPKVVVPPPAAASGSASGSASAAPAAPVAPLAVPEMEAIVEEVRGYEFSVPKGTEHKMESHDSVDFNMAMTKAPYEYAVAVVGFKEKTDTKEILWDKVVKLGTAFEDKDIKITDKTDVGDKYALAVYESVGKDGKKNKGFVLLALDVTDRFMMFVMTDENKFTANEDAMFATVMSFSMYSDAE